jgi:hypothetical protein
MKIPLSQARQVEYVGANTLAKEFENKPMHVGIEVGVAVHVNHSPVLAL